MTSSQKAKGSQWERDVAKAFNEGGFPKVERRYGAGNTIDKGDLNGLPGFVVECKNVGRVNLNSIMDETAVEQANAKVPFGIAVIKRRNKPTGEAHVVMPLSQFIDLLAIATNAYND